ncbi:zinc knuckle CX2CX4HX4C containing protein [Tanacetum coccineum]
MLSITIGIPSLSRDGFTNETIHVEYEWRSPRCDMCKIFGHVHDHCPKKMMSPPIVTTSNVVTPTVEKTNDGFQTVGKNKKRKGKSKSTNDGQFAGLSDKQNVSYEPKATTSAPKKGVTNVGNTSQSSSMLKTTGNSSKKDNLSMSNSFSALNDEEEDDEEDVENVYDESANLIQNTKAGGSSSFMAAANVFLLSHEKCVARYALSRDSKIKRAIFTNPIAARFKNLRATSVVAKSRLSVAKTPTATNKKWVAKLSTLPSAFVSCDAVRFENDHFAAITGYRNYVQLNDYSRYTWVYFLRTKDEPPDMIINFINQVQRNLKAQILKIQTNNGTEFKNEKLRSFYAKLGIVHNTSIAQTPQQNGVVECQNRTLVDAARTMLIFSKSPEFLWAEAIATTCFTQNRSSVHTSLINSQQWLLNATIQNPDSTAQIFKIHRKIHNQYRQKQTRIICLVLCMKNTIRRALHKCQIIPLQNTLDNEDTSSSSSIVVEEDKAPQIVSSLEEQVVSEPNTLVLNDNADELIQEDVAELNINVFYILP